MLFELIYDVFNFVSLITEVFTNLLEQYIRLPESWGIIDGVKQLEVIEFRQLPYNIVSLNHHTYVIAFVEHVHTQELEIVWADKLMINLCFKSNADLTLALEPIDSP